MTLRAKKDNKGFFFTCLGRPECDHAIWLADVIKEVKVVEQNCNKCRNGNKSLSFKFKTNNLLAMLNASLINDNDRTYVSCILCDHSLRVVLEINEANMRAPAAGYGGNQSQAVNRTQNAVRTTNPNTRPPTAPPPPQNRNVPNPRPNPNTNRGGGDAQKCSICNGPVIT